VAWFARFVWLEVPLENIGLSAWARVPEDIIERYGEDRLVRALAACIEEHDYYRLYIEFGGRQLLDLAADECVKALRGVSREDRVQGREVQEEDRQANC